MSKKMNRFLALLLVVVLTFSMSVNVFAEGDSKTTSNCDVQLYISGDVTDYGLPAPSSSLYTLESGMYKSASYNWTIADITSCPVTKPTGFAGMYDTASTYVPTAFDAIYKTIIDTNKMGSATEIGFDTYNSPNGIYFSTISGYGTTEIDSYYSDVVGESYWVGLSWAFYVVPEGTHFDPAEPDSSYLSEFYANNVQLQDNMNYYMIYTYDTTTW